MKRLLFATVGTGDESISSVVHVVREYNPDHVVFLTTAEGRAGTLPDIAKRLGLIEEPSEETELERGDDEDTWTYAAPQRDAFEDELDAERLYMAYREVMYEAFDAHDADVQNGVVDFSEGTRPMSAALFEAAISVGVPVISYVTGERDEAGEVIPGTERSHAVHGRRLRAAETLRDAVDMFNAGRYAVARERASQLEETPEVYLPLRGRVRYVVRTAAAAFEAWDRFRLRDALETMQSLGDEDAIEPSFVARHLMSQDEREAVKQRHLHHAIHEEMYFGLLGDVVANADRRAQQGAWDDAVARLYRGLEYIAQLRIHDSYGFTTAKVPVESLPPRMRERHSDAETCSLALAEAWEFLREDDDPIGATFERLREEEELHRAIRKRNASILAHGFESVGREYVDILRHAVETLARRGWSDERWEGALEACRFPTLEGFNF